MAESKTRLGVSAYAICVFAFTLGSNGVRNVGGWWGFAAAAIALLIWGFVLFARTQPERFRWYRLPAPLYVFLGLTLVSIAWSHYRWESALGVATQVATTAVAVIIAYVLTWHEVLRALGGALRWLIGLSFLFELGVSVFVRQPVYQSMIADIPAEQPSKLLMWSRDLLFSGGPIQGLVANSAMFGFIGLLGLIVFVIQLRAGLVRPFLGWLWVAAAAATLLLTRAATVWVALVAVAIGLGLAVWARRRGTRSRVPVYVTGATLTVLGVGALAFARDALFGLLGKDGDLTGRVEIWDKVSHLAAEQPWFGLGWISYWAPWVEPYASLDTKVGLPVMSAHNAWLDVWLQLGIVGLLAFVPLVALTVWRTWFRAVDQRRRGFGTPLPYATSALWPFLVIVALLVQSLTESRLLIEGNWVLLIVLAVKTRFDFELPYLDDEPRKLPWRQVPIAGETGPVGLTR